MSFNSQKEKHITSSALIIENNKVLLLHHKKLDVWLYPGGHVEEHETPDEALKREVKEETGLEVEIIGEKDTNLEDKDADVSVLYNPYVVLCELVGDHYHVDLVYLCKIIDKSTEVKYSEQESKEIGFFGRDDLDKIKLFPNFRRLLEKVLSQ